jgi:hypothetical protein
MNKLKRRYGSLLLGMLVALIGPAAGQGQKEAGAKALFYDPGTGAILKPSEKQKDPRTNMIKVKPSGTSQAKYVGLHYWIELDGVGPISDEYVFRTGDGIRLHVRSNVDGYLSLWSLDPSGRGSLLFPVPGQTEGENLIKADTPYTTPGKIKFSPPVEDERLLVFFSRSKADIPSPQGTKDDAGMVARSLGPNGSKALVFETEKKTSTELGNYVVNKNGGPIAKEIRLRHRAANR